MWGEEEEHDFAELTPGEKLGRKEKCVFSRVVRVLNAYFFRIYRFVSISAGKDHLLALTSSGRTFAHPINLSANSHGQMGSRKFDIPDHSSITHPHARQNLELTPKAVADPYAKATPAIRKNPEAQPETVQVDDNNVHFSDRLFEIPALKGVQVEQIATGGRSSFVRTSQGRVLGWGANEYG